MIQNPFPGPQPYRASDRGRFYGREDLSYKLAGTVLANRSVTVFGPSGAGKSSLVQASVIPALIESQGVRVVRMDGWPEGEDPARWLAQAVYNDLGLGAPPADATPGEAIVKAAQRAARRSERLVLLYLDQVEQLLYSSRPVVETEPLFECIHALADMPLRNLRLVLSLREDYLGRFRDRLRNRARLLDHGFRVGPMNVAELCDAVCKAAAGGQPPQAWSEEQMRKLMLQVRVAGQAESDEAEAQAAYAQIVCRALFQERAQRGDSADTGTDDVEAEPILQRYLETTLQELGPMREAAQRLLEEHLITADGSRTVRTEKELARLLSSEYLAQILKALEGAAILHAEEHQGSRYFELGHDWLAKKVLDDRQARERTEEQRRREEERRQEIERQRAESEARLAKESARRRRLRTYTIISLFVAAGTAALGVMAWTDKQAAEAARRVADEQTRIAIEQKVEAHDARIIAGFRELSSRGQLAWAMKLLPEVELPAKRSRWVELASDALNENALRATLSRHGGPLTAAAFSPDGKRILTASIDKTARLWNADGTGRPIVLQGHEEAIQFAAFSPDGKHVVTASDDTTARVWNADGTGQPVVLKGHERPVLFAAFSPDGQRVLTASADRTARLWNADGTGTAIVLKGHEGPVQHAIFHPDGVRVWTASADGTARLWSGNADGKHQILRGHEDRVVWLAASPNGKHIVSASLDDTVRVWDASGKGTPVVLRHEGDVLHAVFSPDSRLVATASADRTARVWNADGKGAPVVLKDHDSAVGFVAFSPDGKYVATSCGDIARLWSAGGTGPPLVLRGHESPIRMVTWSPDGTRVLTAGGDNTGQAPRYTAKVWSTELLKTLRHEQKGAGVPHCAFIAADANHVVSAYDDNTARVWSIDGTEQPVVLRGHGGWVSSAAWSPDAKRVVSTSFDHTARVWSADGKGEPITLKGHEAEVRFAVFSPDGTRIVTVSEDRTARVWNADGTAAAVVLQGHEDWLSSAAWSPDGRRVVTTSLDRTARIWNADGSGTPVVLPGFGGDVYAAAFSPDGRRVAVASEDRTVRVWNADGSGTPVLLLGHVGAVTRVIWSSDGTRVATSSFDRTIRLWNAEGKGQPIVLDTDMPVFDMMILLGGQKILTIDSNNTVHSYMVDVEALKQRLNAAHTDCVPAVIRVVSLGESKRTAHEKFTECERSYGRMPAEDKPR